MLVLRSDKNWSSRGNVFLEQRNGEQAGVGVEKSHTLFLRHPPAPLDLQGIVQCSFNEVWDFSSLLNTLKYGVDITVDFGNF